MKFRTQFSLRTLLLLIVLVSLPMAWMGWNWQIVRERQMTRSRIEAMGAVFTGRGGEDSICLSGDWHDAPFPRNLLGDRLACGIYIPATFNEHDIAVVRRVFPEAWVSNEQSIWNQGWVRQNSHPTVSTHL
jgi:hypothetical protein